MSNSIFVQEVRSGLFRINWCLDNIKIERHNGPHEEAKSFQLCGSQLNEKYMISCNRKFVPVAIRGRKGHQLYKLAVGIQLWKILPEQKPNQSEIQPKILDVQSARPVYMWISGLNRPEDNSVHLSESEPGVWTRSFSTLVLESEPRYITLWMDFGMTSTGERKVMSGLAELFLSQSRCDVQFEFQNGENIGAHVLVLSIGSPVFSAMFQSGFKETQTRKVKINEIEVEVFKQLLIYLYTGHAPKLANENITQSLFEVADKYDVQSLKDECINVLLWKKLTIDNALNMLVWSHVQSTPKLFESTLNFVAENGNQLFVLPEWMDLIKNYPELCLLATRRIACILASKSERK